MKPPAPERSDSSPTDTSRSIVKTGVKGLDEILLGGLTADRLYLIEGAPGTGKTTIALQFLLEGKRLGERVLYVTLSETKEELREVARSHGWSLEGIDLYELDSEESRLKPEESYTVFHPEEVELAETAQQVYRTVEEIQPARVVFDSLSEMRLLARDPLRYRRQILGLKQFFIGRGCSVILLDDMVGRDSDLQLQSISHGVIALERMGQEYGVSRRRLHVVKLRGAKFRDGYHDYEINTGGIEVFPRLVGAEHRQSPQRTILTSQIESLNKLLGGGLPHGSSALITGPAGSGKSTLAASYLYGAAEAGSTCSAYIFEERADTLLNRMASLQMDLRPSIEAGKVNVRQVDPAELSPGEFTAALRYDVEVRKAELIVIDSLNGYLNAMPNERFLMAQLHEILSYLAANGVVTLIVMAQHGTIGQMQAPIDVSYLADTLILLRFFENSGSIKKAISVIKHRSSSHEDTIRELQLNEHGIRVGEVLRQFRGVLTGVPRYYGPTSNMLDEKE